MKHIDEDGFYTNSLTFSGRHVDAMVNIDYDSGELNWIIGDLETWPEHMQKYFFRLPFHGR